MNRIWIVCSWFPYRKEKKCIPAAGIPWRVDELAQERNCSRCCGVWQENKNLGEE